MPLNGAERSVPTNSLSGTQDYNFGFNESDYAESLTIDPTNPNVIYLGGTKDGQATPFLSLIRIDATKVNDPKNLTIYDESNNDGGQFEGATTGSATGTPVYGVYQRLPNGSYVPPTTSTPYLNFTRDPENPFLASSTVKVAGITQFNNNGNTLGSPWQFRQHGNSGLWISDLLPHIARQADRLCVVRSMQADFSEHTNANYFIHSGSGIQGRPSMGAWMSYGLGCETADLPAFVVGGAAGKMKGGRHIKYAQPTPLANLLLTILDKVGIHQDTFGDSNGRVEELLAL